MREAAKATGNRQLVWSGTRPLGPPVWSVPRDTHMSNSAYKHSTHSVGEPEVHWAQCQLCAYIIPDVLCNYAQTQVGLVQPRSNLSFAAVPPRSLKELCHRLQGFWCTLVRAKAGRRKVGPIRCLRLFCVLFWIFLSIFYSEDCSYWILSFPLYCKQWVNAKWVWEDGKQHQVLRQR